MKPCNTCNAALDGLCLAVLDEQPSVREFTADGLWIAQIVIAKAGTYVPQHSHSYDHTTMLASGKVRVIQGETVTGVHEAPDGLFIKAGVMHTFETLTDNVIFYCIHHVRDSGIVEIVAENQLV